MNARRIRGFTLIELLIALTLLALMSAVIFGVLDLSGRSYDRGEARVEANAGMRLAQEFLRTNLEAQHPLRLRRVAEFPLMFAGQTDSMNYAAPRPERVLGGGIWYFRLSVAKDDAKSPLILERMIPDLGASTIPEFDKAERSVLAENIAELKIGYYGRDADASSAMDPTWHDKWEDKQRLPMLIRIDVTPKDGPAWPTLIVAPREAPESGCRTWDFMRGRCPSVM